MAEFFPILRVPGVRLPWALVEPHAAQAMKNHGQTLDRLAERGGLSCSEAVAVLEDGPWRPIAFPDRRPSEEAARARLERLIEERTAPTPQPPASNESPARGGRQG